MRSSIVVTGGAGYIGSHVCKALARVGYNPVTFDNLSTGNEWAVRWGALEFGDILDLSRLNAVFKKYRPLAVIHCAAAALVGESMREPSFYYRNNVVGALNVLDACRSHAVQCIVLSSTCAVYGIPDGLPVCVTDATRPVNPYGASKLMAEQLMADHAMAYGLRYAALRYFNVAGADPDGEIGECRAVETHLIPLALDAVLGRRGPLKIMGIDYLTPDGTAIRDYVHVADLADAHVAALAQLRSGNRSMTCNLGTGAGYSVQEIVDAVERVTGRTVPCQTCARRPGDPPALVAGVTQGCLDWQPRWSALDQIVETAWAWHRSMPTTAVRIV